MEVEEAVQVQEEVEQEAAQEEEQGLARRLCDQCSSGSVVSCGGQENRDRRGLDKHTPRANCSVVSSASELQ